MEREVLPRPEHVHPTGEIFKLDVPAIDMAKLVDRTRSGIEEANWEIYQSISGPNGKKLLKKFTPDGVVRVVEQAGTGENLKARLTQHLFEEGVQNFGEGYLETDRSKNYRTYGNDLLILRYDHHGKLMTPVGNKALQQEFGVKSADLIDKGAVIQSSYALQRRYAQERAQQHTPAWDTRVPFQAPEPPRSPAWVTKTVDYGPSWTPRPPDTAAAPAAGEGVFTHYGRSRRIEPAPQNPPPPSFEPTPWSGDWRTVGSAAPDPRYIDVKLPKRPNIDIRRPNINFKRPEFNLNFESPIRFRTAEERAAYRQQGAEEFKRLRERIGSASGGLFDGGYDVVAGTIGGLASGARSARGWVNDRVDHARMTADFKLPKIKRPQFEPRIRFRTAEERAAYRKQGSEEFRKLKERIGSNSGAWFDNGVDAVAKTIGGTVGSLGDARGWFDSRLSHARTAMPDREDLSTTVDTTIEGARAPFKLAGNFAERVQHGFDARMPGIQDQIKTNKERLVASATAGFENLRNIKLPSFEGFRGQMKRLFESGQDNNTPQADSSEASEKARSRTVIDVAMERIAEFNADRARRAQEREQANANRVNTDPIGEGLDRLRGTFGRFQDRARSMSESANRTAQVAEESIRERTQVNLGRDTDSLRGGLGRLRGALGGVLGSDRSGEVQDAAPRERIRDRVSETLSGALEAMREQPRRESAEPTVEREEIRSPGVDWVGTARAAGKRTLDAATAFVGGTAVAGYLGAKGLGNAASAIETTIEKVTGPMIASNNEAARRGAARVSEILDKGNPLERFSAWRKRGEEAARAQGWQPEVGGGTTLETVNLDQEEVAGMEAERQDQDNAERTRDKKTREALGRIRKGITQTPGAVAGAVRNGASDIVTPSARAVQEGLSQPWVTNIFPNGGEAYVQHTENEYVEGSNVGPVIRGGIERAAEAGRHAASSTAEAAGRARRSTSDVLNRALRRDNTPNATASTTYDEYSDPALGVSYGKRRRDGRRRQPLRPRPVPQSRPWESVVGANGETAPQPLAGVLNTQREIGGFPESGAAIGVGSGDPNHWTPPLGTRNQPTEEPVDPDAETRTWTTRPARPAAEAPGWSTETTQVAQPVVLIEPSSGGWTVGERTVEPEGYVPEDTDVYEATVLGPNGDGHGLNGANGSGVDDSPNGASSYNISDTSALNLSDIAHASNGNGTHIIYPEKRDEHGRFISPKTGLNKALIEEESDKALAGEKDRTMTVLSVKNKKPKA